MKLPVSGGEDWARAGVVGPDGFTEISLGNGRSRERRRASPQAFTTHVDSGRVLH